MHYKGISVSSDFINVVLVRECVENLKGAKLQMYRVRHNKIIP